MTVLEKRRARDKLNYAKRAGRIAEPFQCQRCGRPNSRYSETDPEAVDLDAHHEDHERPLDVTWLCRACHRAVDRGVPWAIPDEHGHRDLCAQAELTRLESLTIRRGRA